MMLKLDMMPPLMLCMAMIAPQAIFAQSSDSGQSTAGAALSLAPITIKSVRLNSDILTTPAAVDVIEGRDVEQGRRKTQLDAALNRTPGVYANNGSNFAQNLRVSMRGFGARSAFGVRGVRILVDGIPETLVDGQAQTDSIDLGAIERVEVLRGPFSALYGNATGGVIDITTIAPDDGPFDRGEFAAGAHGYRRESVSSARRFEDGGYAFTASQLRLDGYREHSEVEKRQFTGKFEHDIGATGTLRLTTRLLDAPDTLDPGGVTSAAARADRTAAYPGNIAFDARQSASQQTVGARYHDQISENQAYQASLFYTHRDFIQYLPFEDGGVVTYNRDFFGGGLQTTRYDTFFGHENQLVAGLETRVQQDDRQRYNNLGGDKGALGLDEDQTASSVGVFAQNVFSLTRDMDLTTGLRYDWLDFDIDDHFIHADDPDDSGSRSYKRLSVNAGLSYAWAERQRVYANIANAFESPTFTEFANPAGAGGFNPSLQPQKAVQYEIGAKGEIGGRARYQLSAFWIDVRDELVVFNDDGRRDFYENSGASRRKGLEAKIAYDLTDDLSATAAYTLADYEYRQFVDKNGNDYAGNTLPGLPEQTLFGELAWRRANFGYAVLDLQYAGSIYADNANDDRVDSRLVFNGRIGKDIPAGKDRLTVYLGIDNLFDEKYFDNIRINAFGGRYFEPAPDRTIYAGLKYQL